MNNPVCAVCGHINRDGAVACEACDARLYTADEPGTADSFGDTPPPFDSTSEPSWATSDTGEPRGGAWAPPVDDNPSPADDIPSPAFKGAGDVISPMLAVYRKHFTLVGILVLVTTLPQALLQYGVMGMMGAGSKPVALVVPDNHTVAITILSGLLLWLLALAASALLSGSLVYATVDLQRTGQSSAGECLARGLKALPKVLLVTLLYSVIVLVGYVLLIVPGVIFSLMLAVCVPAAIIEGLGPIEALKRSYEMTKGYKGLIFLTYFLWGVLILVLSWVVTWSFARSGNMDMLPALLLQTAVLGMLNSTAHVLTVYIYLGLLRERRSGFQTGVFTHGPEAASR